MRTQKINKEEVKKQLLKGISPEAISKYQGCSRQYISLIKGELIKEGKLSKGVAGRKAQKMGTKSPDKLDTTIDDQVELTIRAFEALRKQPALEKERDDYRRGYENLKEVFDQQDKVVKKRKDQDLRYKQALGTEQINPPVEV